MNSGVVPVACPVSGWSGRTGWAAGIVLAQDGLMGYYAIQECDHLMPFPV